MSRSSSFVAITLALLVVSTPARADDDPLVTQVEALERAVGADPTQGPKLAAEAARLKALVQAAGKQDLVERLDAASSTARKAWEKAATDAVTSAGSQVEKALVAGSDDPADSVKALDEALSTLDRMPAFVSDAKGKQLDELRRKVVERRMVAVQAKEIFEKYERMRDAEAYARAGGLLKAFDVVSSLKESPWKARAERCVKELEEKRAAAASKVGSEKWGIVFGGVSLKNLDLERGDNWQVPQPENKNEDAVAQVDNDSDSNETACWFGDAETWGDLTIELEFLIGREGFDIKLREAGEAADRPDVCSIRESKGYNRTVIHRLKIFLKGKEGKIVRTDTFETKTFELGREKGRVGLVFPARALVEFRSIKVKLDDPKAKPVDDDLPEKEAPKPKEEGKGKGKRRPPGRPGRPPEKKPEPKKDDGDDD